MTKVTKNIQPKTINIDSDKTLEEILFLDIDYKKIDNLKKLRRINERKFSDIISKLKDCIKEAI